MMKILLLLILLVPGYLWAGDFGRVKSGSDLPCMIHQNGHWLETVKAPALLDLLMRPTLYDGCKIVAGGFLQYEFPIAKLYLSSDDKVLAGNLFGSIALSLRTTKFDIDLDKIKAADGQFVQVAGRFFATSDRGGGIEEVTNINVDAANKLVLKPIK